MKEILEIIEEIKAWNQGDEKRFNDGLVDFDGTFVFKARASRIQKLEKLLITNER